TSRSSRMPVRWTWRRSWLLMSRASPTAGSVPRDEGNRGGSRPGITMKKDDQQLDRLLAAVHRHEATAAPDACFDADTLAAWIDGKLADPALTRAEAHAAACARCQAMLAAMARTAAGPGDLHEAPARSWFRRILPWAGPLTAAAT